MKIALWVITALIALVWTLLAGSAAWVAGWAVDHLDEAMKGLQSASGLPWPAWITLWIDPAWLEGIRQAVTVSIAALTESLPWITPVLGWVPAAIWVVWGLGSLMLLGVAGAVHLGLSAWQRRQPPSLPGGLSGVR